MKKETPPPHNSTLEVILRLQQAEAAIKRLPSTDLDSVIHPETGEMVLISDYQKGLLASHSRYVSILHRLGALILEAKPDGTILFLDESALGILGIRPEDIVGRSLWELLCPAPFHAESERLQVALIAGDVDDFEIQSGAASGQPILWRINSANQYSEDGTLQRIVCVCRDITRLRQDESEAPRAVDNVPGITNAGHATPVVDVSDYVRVRDSEERSLRLVRDLDRRVRQLSVLYETTRLLESHSGQLDMALHEIARLMPSAFPGFSPPQARLRFAGHESATRGFVETSSLLRSVVTMANGTSCSIEVGLDEGAAGRQGPFSGDDQRYLDSFTKLLVEYIERRSVEDRLRQQKELLQNILDNIPVMIAYIGPDGEHRWVNKHWENTLGWCLEDLTGRDILDELYPNPDYRAHVREFILHPTPGWLEFRTTVRGGQILDTYWANVRLSDGSSIAIGTNLTERKRLEEQLLQAQKMESIGRLAGGVAHDFNNILSTILGNVEFALDVLPDGSSALQDLIQIRDSGLRAKELTKQLLAFARKQILETKVVGINDLILGLGRLLKRLIGEDIMLEIQPNASIGIVRCDPGQFHQVLINLVVNARDAMPNGGRIAIRSSDVHLRSDQAPSYADLKDGRYVLIEVNDTGTGIEPNDCETIFEPFFTTKEAGQGTGLGLSTCYGIVKQVNGSIWVTSKKGKGSTFHIALPAVDEPLEPEDTPEPVSAARGGTETILLVEDEPAVRLMACRGLERLGYRVLPAESGMEAMTIAKAMNGRIDLLVTDAVMPRLGGPELIEKLRSDRPGLRVILMSGYTDAEYLNVASLERAVYFLQKPFTPTELGRIVREALDMPPSSMAKDS